MKVVKGEEVPPLVASQIPALPPFADVVLVSDISDLVEVHCETSITADEIENSSRYLSKQLSEELIDEVPDEMPDIESEVKNGLIPPLKICFRNGKQVVSKIESKYVNTDTKIADSEKQSSDSDLIEADEKSSDSSKHPSKSVKKSDKKSNSDKSRDGMKDVKNKDSSKGRSSSSSRSSSSKSSSRSRSSSKSTEHHRRDSDSKKDDKDSSRKHREKDRHRSSENKSKSSSSRDKSKDSRDNDKSKDIANKSKDSKDIIVKSSSPSISKLGKIPKKSSLESNDKGEKKDKPSISIEVRKPNDPNRPKTVKMFHSKFRSHGLEEEARPPPPRGSVKKPTSPVIQPSATKRPSPTRSLDAPPEKKAKVLEAIEKPGAIKLIPAKPKRKYIQIRYHTLLTRLTYYLVSDDLQSQSAKHYWNSKSSMLIESR